ncbi:MAG: hypothetical protein EA419_00130 [Wenzhouxiangella sp.]|nr:MAG: hypothetical protein EA419_00130 [Wenzhouxiangella sp.]
MHFQKFPPKLAGFWRFFERSSGSVFQRQTAPDFFRRRQQTWVESFRSSCWLRWRSGRQQLGPSLIKAASSSPVHLAADSTVNGFEYNRLGPLLIAGFQEQTATNAQRLAALETEHARFASENTRLKSAQQDLAQENAELRAEVSVLKVQSGQVRELERRLAVMEERERENEGLRERLAALEAVLLDGASAVAGAGR